MFKFPSDEWVKEFGNQLNGSEAYARAGKDWKGDFNFIVEADNEYPETVYFFIGLQGGKCTDAAMVPSEKERKAEYSIRGSFGIWRKIIEARLDPIQALMMRKIKMTGNMMKVMRYPNAAREMVNCVSRVPTEFPK
ncbi:MAG: SCP2 sterol-binding domain-containing protein [Dehalococcoidia bacterium]|nr:SCP2 sterol-binding domain-containing protein [Dehalococcoidia bacterium]